MTLNDYEGVVKEEMEKLKEEYGIAYDVEYVCEAIEEYYAVGYTKDGEIGVLSLSLMKHP